MEENKNKIGFKQKFLATRAALEEILFEPDTAKQQKKIDKKYIFYFVSLVVLNLLIVFFYFKKNNGFFSKTDLLKLSNLKIYLDIEWSNILDLFTLSNLNHVNFDMPFYYLSFIPFIKLLNLNYTWAVYTVNSVYVILISVFLYLIISRYRGNIRGLLGVSLLYSLPFFIELEKHFSPQLAVICFALASYYFFFKTENFENNRFIPHMLISLSLGILTDKFFVIYTLPLFYWVNWAFAGIYQHLVIKTVFVAFSIAILYYLRFVLLFLMKYLINPDVIGSFVNFKFYFHSIFDSLSFIIFILVGIGFLWFVFSVYINKNFRQHIYKWFVYPFLIFSVLPYKNPEFIYPALIPLVIGFSSMVPNMLRSAFIFIFILTSGLFNFSVIKPYYSESGYKIFGVDSDYRAKNNIDSTVTVLSESVKENKSDFTVSVYVDNDYFNTYSLKYYTEISNIKGIKFVSYPFKIAYFADYIIVPENLLKKVDKNLFEEKLFIGDIHVFKKKIKGEKLEIDTHRFNIFKLENLELYQAVLKFYDFNPDTSRYKYAVLTAAYGAINAVDVYNVKLRLNNVEVSRERKELINGFKSIDILNMKMSEFSFSRFLQDNFNLINFDISFYDDMFKLEGKLNKKDFYLYMYIYNSKNTVYMKVTELKYGYLKLPSFLCYSLKYRFDLNDVPLPVRFKKLKIGKGLILINS